LTARAPLYRIVKPPEMLNEIGITFAIPGRNIWIIYEFKDGRVDHFERARVPLGNILLANLLWPTLAPHMSQPSSLASPKTAQVDITGSFLLGPCPESVGCRPLGREGQASDMAAPAKVEFAFSQEKKARPFFFDNAWILTYGCV
jgi:hypothetical protein